MKTTSHTLAQRKKCDICFLTSVFHAKYKKNPPCLAPKSLGIPEHPPLIFGEIWGEIHRIMISIYE